MDFYMLLGVKETHIILQGTYYKIKSVDYACIIIKCECQHVIFFYLP